MNKKLLTLLPASLMVLASCGGGNKPSSNPGTSVEPVVEDNKVHIVILAGQSGARGKALNSDLDDEQKETNTEVDICADGLAMPQLSNIPEHIKEVDIDELKPGFGDGSSEHGPELGMGHTLASRYQKDGDLRKTVIVKYTACGSTFTSDWFSESGLKDPVVEAKLNKAQLRVNELTEEETGPLTNNLYELITYTQDLLTDEGFESVIDGAVWVHGEQDTKFDDNMSIYEDSLKYFIKDLRSYVNNETLPVVVTEALTNSGKYSNKLREIQKRVADGDANVAFLDNSKLYTNTFEPWHLGAKSNYEFGNRIAAELISLADSRTIQSVDEDVIKVPHGVDVALPQFIKCTYTNGYEGYSKVKYPNGYDKNKLGEQDVKFVVDCVKGNQTEGVLKVKVVDEPFVDGKLNDLSLYDKLVDEEGRKFFAKAGEEGVYFAGEIDDSDLWTDGENWKNGDMGQSGRNDDMRIFIANGDASNRTTACLSAANLLRVYTDGVTLKETGLPNKNKIYMKDMSFYDYRVTTEGLVNVASGDQSEGLKFELYLNYEDLGIEDASELSVMFAYSNISNPNDYAQDGKSARTETLEYFYNPESGATSNFEADLTSYFSL